MLNKNKNQIKSNDFHSYGNKIFFQLKEKTNKLEKMVDQLQQLNANLQEKLHSDKNGIVRGEFSMKNDAALKSLIKHITPSPSDDKVCKMNFFRLNFSNQ